MRSCLIEGILPVNAIHLLGGSPGAGKTRFSFGLIDQWQRNQLFLGHAVSPAPYCFVSLDRPRDSVEETLETMGLLEQVTRLICLDELSTDHKVEAVIDAACEKYPDTQMLFIEGFQLFAGDFINRYAPVANLLKRTSRRCASSGLTILGVCHASKTKKGAEFLKGRDRIGGTVAWSAFSETVIIVDADEETKIRTVDIYPRNAPEEKHQMMMTSGGVLVSCPREKGEQAYLHILAIPEGAQLQRQQLLAIAESSQIGEKTIDRAIKRAIDEHQIEQIDEGIYKRTYTV